MDTQNTPTLPPCHCGKPANDYGNGIEYICEPCFTTWQNAGEPESCPCVKHFPRGSRWNHHRLIQADINHTPQVVQVTSSKRYTTDRGEESTRIFYTLVITYCTGREEARGKYHCDIRDAMNWTPAG